LRTRLKTLHYANAFYWWTVYVSSKQRSFSYNSIK